MIGILALVLPLWTVGIWQEHQTEAAGADVIGRAVAGEWLGVRRPSFTIEYPIREGVHRKVFGVTQDEAGAITNGTDQILQPEILMRVHPDYPEAARIAAHTPLPWWGGVIGMIVTLGVLTFALSLPPKKR